MQFDPRSPVPSGRPWKANRLVDEEAPAVCLIGVLDRRPTSENRAQLPVPRVSLIQVPRCSKSVRGWCSMTNAGWVLAMSIFGADQVTKPSTSKNSRKVLVAKQAKRRAIEALLSTCSA